MIKIFENNKPFAAVCLTAVVFTAAAAFAARLSINKQPAVYRVASMEGYASRYEPGHVSSGEAWAMAERADAYMIIDLRGADSYGDRHVDGAVNVDPEALAAYADESITDKNYLVLLYCYCGDAGGAALYGYKLLTEMGYTNVFYSEPGDEWAYAGNSAGAPVYTTVTGAEAMRIFTDTPGAVLLDVRNRDEYDEKHIEGSVLIPVAELGSRLSELDDRDAAIVVYCRAGARSKTAADLLAANGYKYVYDMGRVDDWPEPLVKK